MKRILLLVILLFVSLSGFCVDWNLSGGLFLHDSAVYGLKPEAAIVADIDDFSVGAMVSDYSGALDFSYDHSGENTFRCTAGTSINGYYNEGGLWTIYADFGQDLRFWDRLSIKYRGGVQFGLSWSHYAPLSAPVSLSPYAYWAIGYDDDVCRAMVYGHSMRVFEHTFQAPPVLGIELGWNIDGRNGIAVDTYMKLADYMEGPDLMITDVACRVFYTYVGGRA